MTTWRVGAILNESVSDTLRFASWYLEAGAEGLTLLFDDPEDKALSLLADHPKIDVYPATPEFWAKLGRDPADAFTKRQNAALNWIYRNTEEDWLLNVDADEFVLTRDETLTEYLAKQSETVNSIRINVAEVVGTDDPEGFYTFRRPMAKPQVQAVYGENAIYFGPRRMGLIGHSIGKSVTRTALQGVRLRQHWADGPEHLNLRETFIPVQDGIELLHFIGLDYEPWRRKLDWRLKSRGFVNPLKVRINEVKDGPDGEAKLKELHAKLHRLSPSRVQTLLDLGVGFTQQIDFEAIVSKHFPTYIDR